MARSIDAKCRKCRRSGEKLFLKGDRCLTPKCGMVRRAYGPGVHGKTSGGGRGKSEFGTQLAVKQKLKRVYGVLEKQFRHHFEEVKNRPGVAGDLLMQRLEKRLDNAVYRSGFAVSRSQARQIVNHGLIYLNGRKLNIPSAKVRIGDIISINENKVNKNYFKNLNQTLSNKKDFPSWIEFDAKEKKAKIVSEPKIDEIGVNVDAQLIVEFYSR